jgi:hypothetical protein
MPMLAPGWKLLRKKFGREIAFEEVRPLIGMGGDRIIPKLVLELSSEEGEGKNRRLPSRNFSPQITHQL